MSQFFLSRQFNVPAIFTRRRPPISTMDLPLGLRCIVIRRNRSRVVSKFPRESIRRKPELNEERNKKTRKKYLGTMFFCPRRGENPVHVQEPPRGGFRTWGGIKRLHNAAQGCLQGPKDGAKRYLRVTVDESVSSGPGGMLKGAAKRYKRLKNVVPSGKRVKARSTATFAVQRTLLALPWHERSP